MRSLPLVARLGRGKCSRYRPALVIAFALSILAGCAPEQVAKIAADAKERELLAFLVDGKTRKEEVLTRLGLPTGTFEGERILTYRMMLHSEKGFVPIHLTGLQADVSSVAIHLAGLQADVSSVEKDHQGGMQRSQASTWKGYYQIVLVFDAEDIMEIHKIMKHKDDYYEAPRLFILNP